LAQLAPEGTPVHAIASIELQRLELRHGTG
jgi:hypothetical protein